MTEEIGYQDDEPHGAKTSAETLGGSDQWCELVPVFIGEDDDDFLEILDEPEPEFFYVNVYLIDRAYGGPQEGGWWYDCGVPATDLPGVPPCYGPFGSREEAAPKLSEIMVMVDKANEGRRDIDSVLSDGRYATWIEGHTPKAYPETRPHYE